MATKTLFYGRKQVVLLKQNDTPPLQKHGFG